MRLGAILAILAVGCGAPTRRPQNSPPRFDDSATSPASPFTIGNGPRCAVTFSARAEDPDLGDVLYGLWFIDDFNRNAAPIAQAELPPSGAKERPPLELAESVGAATSALHASGQHLVELIVSDGVLEGREPLPRERLGDGAKIETFAATLRWELEVQQGVDCP
ncbi:MAG: hypothetical protein HYZ28_13355 [Myxococcales bacterium]|nr:hypothetical protein [Myxococcales bacterium]